MAMLRAELEGVGVRRNHLVLAVHTRWLLVMERMGLVQKHHLLAKEAMSHEEDLGAGLLVAVEELVLTEVGSRATPLLMGRRGFAG